MKKVLFSIIAMVVVMTAANAQSVNDPQDSLAPNDFYQKGIVVGKKPMPFPYLRESDVVWEMVVWRKIDFNESFNQFFYFPTDMERSTQGRINLINLILKGAGLLLNDDGSYAYDPAFEVFEDDDMKVPLDRKKALANLQGQRKQTVAGEEDEFGDIEYKDTTMADPFDPATVKMAQLKECWYIDKQTTRQKVRILGLAFNFTKNMVRAGAEEETPAETFWVPMNFMTVRQVLVNANAYDDNNDIIERSYDDIFLQRYFDSYITRESNKYNRAIDTYLTGEDAILESQRIEEKIFNIESDMWEY